MGKDILHRVGNGGHCGCETVSREVLLQVEIPEKWTQEPPCFAITIWCAIKIAHQWSSNKIQIFCLWKCCLQNISHFVPAWVCSGRDEGRQWQRDLGLISDIHVFLSAGSYLWYPCLLISLHAHRDVCWRWPAYSGRLSQSPCTVSQSPCTALTAGKLTAVTAVQGAVASEKQWFTWAYWECTGPVGISQYIFRQAYHAIDDTSQSKALSHSFTDRQKTTSWGLFSSLMQWDLEISKWRTKWTMNINDNSVSAVFFLEEI